MPDVSPDLFGRTVDGFRIECRLGQGGMGAVWKAWDTRLDRQVALKVLASSDRDDAVRFEREAKAVSGISHPNIAHVYATGRVDGRPYYVMELIEGRSLGKILEEEGRIPGRRCLDYLRQAAEGLGEARSRGVIHRDVKPDNLMVDTEDRLKVVDFGLARRIEGNDASLTQTNMVVGTPKYMAPEQAVGGAVDHRSDIYALGATFYHLLSGQPPFDAPTPVAVMMKHVHDPLVPLRERVPQIPVGVSAIVDRMMAKAPEGRYQSYEDLIADVKKALSGAAPRVAASTVHIPTPARPAPAPASERTRPPWTVVAALAGALGILVFLAFRAGRDTKEGTLAPAPRAAAPSARLAPTTDERGAPGERTGPGDSGPRGLPAPGETSPPQGFVGMVQMAFHAKSMAHLRKVATALEVYANSNEMSGGLPQSLQELTKDDRYGLHPKELNDGWGNPIRYVRVDPYKFRLSSDGADGVAGNGDDIVLENGVVVQGEVQPPGVRP